MSMRKAILQQPEGTKVLIQISTEKTSPGTQMKIEVEKIVASQLNLRHYRFSEPYGDGAHSLTAHNMFGITVAYTNPKVDLTTGITYIDAGFAVCFDSDFNKKDGADLATLRASQPDDAGHYRLILSESDDGWRTFQPVVTSLVKTLSTTEGRSNFHSTVRAVLLDLAVEKVVPRKMREWIKKDFLRIIPEKGPRPSKAKKKPSPDKSPKSPAGGFLFESDQAKVVKFSSLNEFLDFVKKNGGASGSGR